jgi:hypothetical protein
MEPKGSSPHSQAAATYSYPEPDHQANPSPSHFLEIHFNITRPYTTCVFRVVYFLQVSPPNTLYAPFLSTVHKTFPNHLIILD